MRQLFLDTNFVVALNAIDDQSHALAVDGWAAVLSNRTSLVTTTFVLDETVTFLNSRGLHQLAVEVGTQLLQGSAILMVHVDPTLLSQGWAYFARHADKRYSLTDCISFAVMQNRGIREALTFDQHFSRAGFEMLPRV